jgi:hypothetical protein
MTFALPCQVLRFGWYLRGGCPAPQGSAMIERLHDLFPVIFINLYNVSYEILTQRFHIPDIY